VTDECREVRGRADAFLSGQLLVETMQDVLRHLDGCAACRAEFEGRRRLRTALRSAFEGAAELQPRPEFVAGLRLRLADAALSPAPRSPAWRRWGALAASLAVVAGLAVAALPWLSSAALAELARLAVGDHQNCAISFGLAEPPIPLARAARDYDAAFGPLDAVEPSSRVLAGGPLSVVDRHSCVWGGVRFAHLVLRYKDTLVSVVIASDRAAASSWIPWSRLDHAPTARLPVDGQQVMSYRAAGHTVFVVSALPADDVQAVAGAMVGPVARALAGA